MSSRLQKLPENWRDKVRVVLPDDDILPPWRDHFLDWVIEKIEVELNHYFVHLEYGGNQKDPAPKEIAARASQLEKSAQAFSDELKALYAPQDQDERSFAIAFRSALKQYDVNLAEVQKPLTVFHEALCDIASAYDRPSRGGRSIKRADRALTQGLVRAWTDAYGKPPTVVNRKDGTRSGPFFDLLTTIEHLVGAGYSASGQWQWFKQLKGR